MVELLHPFVLRLRTVLIDVRDEVLPVSIEMQLYLQQRLYLASILLLVVMLDAGDAFLVAFVHLAVIFDSLLHLQLVLLRLLLNLLDLVLLSYLLIHRSLHRIQQEDLKHLFFLLLLLQLISLGQHLLKCISL